MEPAIPENTDVYRVETAHFTQFFYLLYQSINEYWQRYSTHYRAEYYVPQSFIRDFVAYGQVFAIDVFLVLFLACLFTVLRAQLTKYVFLAPRTNLVYFSLFVARARLTPLAHRLKLIPKNVEKFPESCWKLLFYSCSWAWSVYVMLLSGRYNTFWDPLSVWDEWSPKYKIPLDIYTTYIVQASFYLHSVYGTLYMDIWRKDSKLMITHHYLTLCMIVLSYTMKFVMAGGLVLLLHDITDVELEFTKLNTYLKKRGGRVYWVHEVFADVGFALFAVSWFLFRLYWFPLKVIYTVTYGAVFNGPFDLPFIPVCSVFINLLFIMDIYWFHYILLMLYKVATGRAKEIDDTREYDTNGDEIKKPTKEQNNTHNQNGVSQHPNTYKNGYTKHENNEHKKEN